MKNRQLTPRERAEKEREFAIKTLENKTFHDVLSGNKILKNQSLYGDLAVKGAESKYGEAINSEEAREIRNNLRKKAKEEGDGLDVYGSPSIGDYEVSKEILQQLKENKLKLPLKDLGALVKNFARNHKYNFEVPKGLENYIPLQLEMKRQMAGINPTENALTEKETQALNVYNFLSEVYDRVISLGACDYLADLNELGEKMMKMYGPKESKE